MSDTSDIESVDNSKSGDNIGSKVNKNGSKVKKAAKKATSGVTSTHASVLIDSVGPPSAEVCRAAASFP
jgi:hypothetical protein